MVTATELQDMYNLVAVISICLLNYDVYRLKAELSRCLKFGSGGEVFLPSAVVKEAQDKWIEEMNARNIPDNPATSQEKP